MVEVVLAVKAVRDCQSCQRCEELLKAVKAADSFKQLPKLLTACLSKLRSTKPNQAKVCPTYLHLNYCNGKRISVK